MKKRILSFAMAAIMVLSMLPMSAFAAEMSDLTVTAKCQEDVLVGDETATVDLVVENNPGFKSIGLFVEYDTDALSFKELINPGEVFSEDQNQRKSWSRYPESFYYRCYRYGRNCP